MDLSMTIPTGALGNLTMLVLRTVWTLVRPVSVFFWIISIIIYNAVISYTVTWNGSTEYHKVEYTTLF